MLILTNTTDNLQVTLAGAITTNQLACYSSLRDITSSNITPNRTVISTNNTTPVNVVASPAASTQRVVDYLSIYNSDTNSAGVTVNLNANGVLYPLFKTTLAVGEKLEFVEGAGFRVISVTGAVKTSLNQGGAPLDSTYNELVLGSNIINSNAVANTLEDISGLEVPVFAGFTTYFEFVLIYQSALATNGCRFTITGPSFTTLAYVVENPSNATTKVFTHAATYQLPAASNTSTATTTGNIAKIYGMVTPSVDGSIQPQFASELASTATTVLTGSFGTWRQL